MAETKHTPGPWNLSKPDVESGNTDDYLIWVPAELGRYEIVERVGGQVYDHGTGEYLDYSEVEANAHLIAAAPELLEVAEMVLDQLHCLCGGLGSPCNPCRVKAVIRAAIANAKGETP
jgi:hypothetical protein